MAIQNMSDLLIITLPNSIKINFIVNDRSSTVIVKLSIMILQTNIRINFIANDRSSICQNSAQVLSHFTEVPYVSLD